VGHNREEWNAEAVLIALQPWEIDVLHRGLHRLAELAEAHPDLHGILGHGAKPARAILEKIDLVLHYQGYGGLAGLRDFVAERRDDEVDASAF
jgi:hypothetical protein